jgi:spermidine synthase
VSEIPDPKKQAVPGIHFSEAGGLRHLHMGGSAIQSAMRLDAPDDLALAYTRAMMAALLFQPQPRDVVLVGLGGGSLAKFIYRQMPRTRIVGLEVDVRVVAAAHRMFHLPLGKRRRKVLVRDGADYLPEQRGSFDLVFLDAFVNHRQAPTIRTAAFYRDARAALRPGGVLVVNYMTDDPGLRAYLRRLSTAFEGRLLCLRAIGEDNVIVFAFGDDPGVVTPASLAGRAIALQRRYGLEFRRFAEGLRPMDRVRIDGLPLLTARELQTSGCKRSPGDCIEERNYAGNPVRAGAANYPG